MVEMVLTVSLVVGLLSVSAISLVLFAIAIGKIKV